MMHLRSTLSLLLMVSGITAAAAEIPAPLREHLEPGPSTRGVEVVDDDTVVLEDGRQVRLVGIQAPKLPLGRPGFEKWPLADEAKEALESLILGKTVTLAYGGLRVDRYNRQLAHLFTEDRGWVQAELLKSGLARASIPTTTKAAMCVCAAGSNHTMVRWWMSPIQNKSRS
jgi:micrococcal nuclease